MPGAIHNGAVPFPSGAYDAFDEAVLDATPLPSDFERYCNLGDDRQVQTVFVRGRTVLAGAASAGASP